MMTTTHKLRPVREILRDRCEPFTLDCANDAHLYADGAVYVREASRPVGYVPAAAVGAVRISLALSIVREYRAAAHMRAAESALRAARRHYSTDAVYRAVFHYHAATRAPLAQIRRAVFDAAFYGQVA